MKAKIIRNTAINSLGKIISQLVGMFVVAYSLGKLGKESYGLIVLAQGLVSNTNLLESGFGVSATKYIAEYHAAGEKDKVNEVINANLLIILLQSAVICLLFYALSHFFLNYLFTIPLSLQANALKVIDIFILIGFLKLLSACLNRIGEGFQKYSTIRLIEIVNKILEAIFITLFLFWKANEINLAIAILIANGIALFLLLYHILFKTKEIRLGLKHISFKTFKDMSSFSLAIFIGKIYAFISYRIDIFVIGHFLSTTALTYYEIAFKLYEMMRYIPALILSTIMPVSSELFSTGQKTKLMLLFKKATKYSMMISYPIAIWLFFAADKVITLWVGTGYQESVYLLKLFLVTIFPTVLTFCGTEMMVGINKLWALLKYSGVAAVVNLIVSIWLVQKIGTPGVVIGTIVGSLIAMIGYLPVIVKALTDSSLTEFISTVALKNLLISTGLALLFMLSSNLFWMILITIGYALLAYCYIIDTDDRLYLSDWIHNRFLN